MNKEKTTKKKSSQSTTVKGKLDISRSGMAYVIVEGMDKDIVVRPNDIGRGFHGDTVKVQISPDSGRGRRTEGKVTEVVTRNQATFIGNISVNKNVAFFKAATEKPMPDFYIPMEKLNGAADGERVVAKLIKWDKADKKPEGEVVTILKSEDVNDMAMKEILIETGFPLVFEKAVLDEAGKLSDTITREELKKRKDYRDILTFTIDPEDAKDFDDAISIRNLDNGNYEIGVHIADVSHFVKPDSILDKSAYERATSVYLPDRVNPMLPEKISNELCSLRPNEDKYTFSADFQITNRGEIKHRWIGRTIIHSDHRFTYEDVQTIIETKDGGYAISGYTDSQDGDVSGNHGNQVMWVVKLKGNVNKVENSSSNLRLMNYFNIYPNPSSEQVHLQMWGKQTVQKVTLYDILGREIPSVYTLDGNAATVNVHALIPGVYIGKLAFSYNDYTGSFMQPFLVQH